MHGHEDFHVGPDTGGCHHIVLPIGSSSVGPIGSSSVGPIGSSSVGPIGSSSCSLSSVLDPFYT